MSSGLMPLRVVIVDDEPLARSRMKALLMDCDKPRCAIVAECGSAEELLGALRHGHADCVLLDIQMPGMNGLEVAAKLRAESASKPSVIFVTAHEQHALAAFDLEASDYLTKPVRRERLQAALERVQRQRPAGMPDGAALTLVASERGRVARIPVSEVLYLRAEAKYVNLRTAARTWVLDESLSELENRLNDPARFLRIHRNAVIAVEAVGSFEKHVVDDGEDGASWAVQIAATGEWLAVSRRQLSTVKDALADLALA